MQLTNQLRHLSDRLLELWQEAIAQQIANERDPRRGSRAQIRKLYGFVRDAIARIPTPENTTEIPVPESLEEIAALTKDLHDRSRQLTVRLEQGDTSTVATEIAYLRAGAGAIDQAVASNRRDWAKRTGFESSPGRRAYKARWKRERDARLRGDRQRERLQQAIASIPVTQCDLLRAVGEGVEVDRFAVLVDECLLQGIETEKVAAFSARVARVLIGKRLLERVEGGYRVPEMVRSLLEVQ